MSRSAGEHVPESTYLPSNPSEKHDPLSDRFEGGRSVEPRPLFGGDDEERIYRGRGIYFFRQLPEGTDVVLPLLPSAFHQFTDRFADMSDVIDTINNIGLQFQSSPNWVPAS